VSSDTALLRIQCLGFRRTLHWGRLLCLQRAFFVWRGSAVLGALSAYLAPIFLPCARATVFLRRAPAPILFRAPLFPLQQRALPLYLMFNLSFASMASNSKRKKKARKHGGIPTAPASVLPSPSTGVDSSQANPCVNPWYLSIPWTSLICLFENDNDSSCTLFSGMIVCVDRVVREEICCCSVVVACFV
jgi:hypothetical protein